MAKKYYKLLEHAEGEPGKTDLYDAFKEDHPKYWQEMIDSVVETIETIVMAVEGNDFGSDCREDLAIQYCEKWEIRFDRRGNIKKLHIR